MPDNRQNVILHHLDLWTDSVHVSRRALLSNRVQSGRVLLLSKAHAHQTLNLRTLVKDARHLLDLYVWELVAHGLGQAVRRHPQPVEMLGVEPMVLPCASQALALRASDGPGDVMNAMSRFIDDEVAVHVIAEVDLACANSDSDHARFSDLNCCHIDDVARMADAGALEVWQDEFGDLLVRKAEGGTRYVNVQSAGLPMQIIRVDRCSPNSKLDVVLGLLRLGWTAGAARANYQPGGRTLFVCSWLRPTSYFNCLLNSAELFSKGVPSIPHKAISIHYQCMLRLQGRALAEFLAKFASDEAGDAVCRKLLKGPDVLLAVCDRGDVAEAADCDDDPEELESQPGVLREGLMPAILGGSETDWKRTIVHVSGWDAHKVLFDHSSHASGRQRGYIECKQRGHKHCLRYTVCDAHASRERCVAWLFAWAVDDAERRSRLEHIGHDPDEAQVLTIMRSMRLEAF